MESLTSNLGTSRVRKVKFQGRDYFVAPVVLINPGVLNGSKGPLYYPPDEVSKVVDAWNHVPIVVYHPEDDKGHTTARDPEVLEKQGIGFLLNSKFQRKLRSEAWVDAERVKVVDKRVYDALKDGKPMEVSTGLFTDNEEAAQNSSINGKAYTFIARNYKPDHLAILPDQRGACSLRDGCGLNVNRRSRTNSRRGNNNSKEMKNMVKNKTQKLTDDRKQEIITNLLACNECSPNGKEWTDEDKEALNAAPEEALMTMAQCQEKMKSTAKNAAKKSKEDSEKLAQAEKVANAAREGFEDQQGDSHFFDEKAGKWTTKKKVTANSEGGGKKEPEKPQTYEEVYNSLPKEMQDDLRFARNTRENQRRALIEKVKKLVANVSDEDRKERLLKGVDTMSIERLEEKLDDLSALAPTKTKEPTTNWAGAVPGTSGRPVLNEKDREGGLGLPVMNFEIDDETE